MSYNDVSFLNRIDEKLKIIQSQRPLSPAHVAKLREQFGIEMTYNSNAIEGNRLTLKETYFVIQEGITVKGKTLKEHLEAKNHYEAISYLYDLIEQPNKYGMSEVLIRSIQQLVVQDTDKDSAGVYRTGNVRITGSRHVPPDAVTVPERMRELVTWYESNKSQMHIVELAAIFHHKFVHIHPFFDGNGRTARLLMNIILMSAGYPLVIILKNDRRRYYSALDQADKGKLSPFIRFIAQAVERSLNMYVKVIVPFSKNTQETAFSLSKIAQSTPYSEKYLNLLARMGKIEAYKEGRDWVVSKEAIQRYIAGRKRNRRLK